MHSKHKTEKNIKDPQKKYHLGTVSKIFYWGLKLVWRCTYLRTRYAPLVLCILHRQHTFLIHVINATHLPNVFSQAVQNHDQKKPQLQMTDQSMVLRGRDVEASWLLHANNKGADQPVHSCSLDSAFVIALWKYNSWTCWMQNFNILASL